MQIFVRLAALALSATMAAQSAFASNQAITEMKQREEKAFREYKVALAERLSIDSNPRRRMAAAILISGEAKLAGLRRANADSTASMPTQFPLAPDVDELVSSALAQAPDDPLMLWVAATNCPASVSACEPERSLNQLRELQPENVMVWLQSSASDHNGKTNPETITATANDAFDEVTRLRNIARATSMDGFNWGVQRLLFDAFLQLPLPNGLLEAGEFAEPTQEKMAVISAIGYEMAFVTPHYGQVSKLCGQVAIAAHGEPRRELCIAALRNIGERADTMLAEQFALSRLLQLLPEGKERNAIQIWRHRSRWQLLAYTELLIPPAEMVSQMDAEAERHIAHLRLDGKTEITAMREVLTKAGISLEPPSGWTSPYDDVTSH